MKRRSLALIPVLLVAACLGSDFADSLEGSWVLESATQEGEPIELQPSHPVSLILGEDTISGTAACNSYQSGYQLEGSRFEIVDGVAVTEMACIPNEVMTTERRYLDALLATDTVAWEDGRLILSGPESQLVFTAGAESEDD